MRGIREVMKTLRDINNNPLNTDKEKAERLISDNFVWNEEGRKLDKEELEADE